MYAALTVVADIFLSNTFRISLLSDVAIEHSGYRSRQKLG